MTQAQDPVSFPTDPYPVRPGTSAALTARTIDATVHPPLVRAQEKVADLVPRVTASLGDPLLMVSLAGTLVLMWLAVRMRSRLAPVLLSAMLLMTLTSFRPTGNPDEAQISDGEVQEDYEPPRRLERRKAPPRAPEPPPYVSRFPRRPDAGSSDLDNFRLNEEELRAAIEELTLRIESELRRRGAHRHYDPRSARWIRRLPPELQEWVGIVREQAVAALDRDR